MTDPNGDPDVDAVIAAIGDPSLRADCLTLIEMMTSAAGVGPRMWGPKLVGFGEYHYRYASDREGDASKIGFAPSGRGLTIYLLSGMVGYEDLLDRLGKHTRSKSCLYVRRLSDLDLDVLGHVLDRCVRHLDQVVRTRGSIPRISEMPPWDPD